MTELEEQLHPEILRSNLANTVLELAKLGGRPCVRWSCLTTWRRWMRTLGEVKKSTLGFNQRTDVKRHPAHSIQTDERSLPTS